MVDFGPGGRRVVVIDVFKNRFEGLALAEVEFDEWQRSREFRAPDWLGSEVTHDHEYRNQPRRRDSASCVSAG
jgi:CYTH domain-containing protein